MQITFEEQNQCSRSHAIFQRKGPSAGQNVRIHTFEFRFKGGEYFVLRH